MKGRRQGELLPYRQGLRARSQRPRATSWLTTPAAGGAGRRVRAHAEPRCYECATIQ
jgi:hypothetical protein